MTIDQEVKLEPGKRKRKSIYLMRLIGLFILVYILYKIDWRESVVLFKKSNYIGFLTAFLLNIPVYFLKAFRWKLLLQYQNHPLKTSRAVLYQLSSSYISFITPGRVGEFVKIFYLSEDGVCSVSQGISSVLIARLQELYLFILIGIWGLILYFPFPYHRYFLFSLLLFLFIAPPLVLNVSLLKRSINLFIEKTVSTRLFSFSKLNGTEFKEDFEKLIDNRLFITFGMTLATSALIFFQIYVIMVSVHIPLSYFEVIPVIALAELVTLLPISISGLGTREAVLLFCLVPLGISREQVILSSLGLFLLGYVGNALFGAAAWFKKPVSFGSAGSREATPSRTTQEFQ